MLVTGGEHHRTKVILEAPFCPAIGARKHFVANPKLDTIYRETGRFLVYMTVCRNLQEGE